MGLGVCVAAAFSMLFLSHPPRDAVVGALMPACMIMPVECPSSSPVPPSDSSAASSPYEAERSPLVPESEERHSPSPWQERKGEVMAAFTNQPLAISRDGRCR